MTRVLRTYLALTLSLVLVVTGIGSAAARGMPGPAGQMVICTGHGPVMIYLDEHGEPTRAPHLCPDGALSLLQMAGDMPAPDAIRPFDRQERHSVEHLRAASLISPEAQARGPPDIA